jgi:NADH-quinone oxidoreductase subunit D
MTYNQFIPYTDRLDYLAPLANNVAYALAVEKLLGIHDLPPRCQYIRVICCELARISSHLLGVGCFAMDVGCDDGVPAHVHGAREDLQPLRIPHRRAVHDQLHAHRRRDARLPPGWCDAGPQVPQRSRRLHRRVEKLLTRNRIWVDRTAMSASSRRRRRLISA